MNFLRALFSAWTWRMAWRDSRASRRKLLLFSSSIVIGIAALVAISSFGYSLKYAIEEQAKGLLGADLVLSARDPFTPEIEDVFTRIGGEQARETAFSSMVYFTRSEGTRLVQVRAVERGFPFYGALETDPVEASGKFRETGGALVEESLLYQYDSKVGEEVKVGKATFRITGSLLKVPGETAVFATIAPRVYIPFEKLEETGLLTDDSFARFKIYFKLAAGVDVEGLLRGLRPELERHKLNSDTVEERKRNLGRSLDNLHNFLNLGGFIALLLGAIGIASAIHVHVSQKTGSIAVLRCMGCSIGQTFAIYLLQAMGLGALGAVAGAGLGLLVQELLPRVLADFIPFQLTVQVAWWPVLRAMLVGFAVSLVFALLPLIGLRRIAPLAVLRSSYERLPIINDPVRILLYATIIGVLLIFARAQTHRWTHALGFAGGIALSFLLLAVTAQLVRGLARKIISPAWPYVWRQGLANLYRPNNRTLLLLLSLGLGTFLVLTIYLLNRSLSADLFPPDRENQPNAALFDIQHDQKEGVKKILKENDLPVLQEVPIVTMRLAQVKGVSTRELLRKREMPRWALRREYRSTYRDTLESSEETVAGTWPVKTESQDGIVPVSIEEGISRDLQAGIGDELVFDVQGLPITNRIVHVRKVDWKRVQPNFFMVFPTGILEEAPAFNVITTRVTSREKSAAMQRAMVKAYPNVSTIDLTLVLDTVDAILSKISFVVRFMALFTVLTGLIVLVAAILTGRYQRIQESILLRTLGASRKDIQRILMIEYFLIGFLAGITGIVLAQGGAWALAKWVFKISYTPAVWPLVVTVVAVSATTIITGLIANRGVLKRPPLEILRQSG